jgi:hypothetical protein
MLRWCRDPRVSASASGLSRFLVRRWMIPDGASGSEHPYFWGGGQA